MGLTDSDIIKNEWSIVDMHVQASGCQSFGFTSWGQAPKAPLLASLDIVLVSYMLILNNMFLFIDVL